jgi:hypothetical protein
MSSLPPPRPTVPTRYKQPGRFNAVSVTLFLLMAAGVYVLYCTWPIVTLRLRVKGDLEDVMNRYWRANLAGGASLDDTKKKLRAELIDRATLDGVKDKKIDIVFGGDKKRISIEARFSANAYFPVLDRTFHFDLAPSAETDAARVDW